MDILFRKKARDIFHDLKPNIVSNITSSAIDNDFLLKTLQDSITETGVKELTLEAIVPLNARQIHDFDNKSDVLLTTFRYHYFDIRYRGTLHRKVIALPYLKDNKLYVSGVPYKLMTVKDQTVITLTNTGALLNMSKNNIAIETMPMTMFVNGVEESTKIIYTESLFKDHSNARTCPIIAYTLQAWGVRKLFRKVNFCKQHQLPENRAGLHIIEPSQLLVRKYGRLTDVCITIDSSHSKEELNNACNIMAMFIQFPDMADEFLEMWIDPDTRFEDEQIMWTSLMAKIHSNGKPLTYNLTDMTEYCATLPYDEQMKFDMLREVGIDVNSFVELLLVVSTSMIAWEIHGMGSTVRRVTTKNHLYYPIISMWNIMLKQIRGHKDFDTKMFKSHLATKMGRGRMYSLIKHNSVVKELNEQVGPSGFIQSLSGTDQDKSGAFTPSGEDAMCANIYHISKSDPYAKTINPFVQIDDDGCIRPPDTKDLEYHLRLVTDPD